MSLSYDEFLQRKVVLAPRLGFDVDPAQVNPRMKPHCRAIVPWLLAGGRRALFARFGLHKTVMQLEAVRLASEHVGGRGLIVVPLNVRQEFMEDAVERLGWLEPPKFIRRIEEAGPTGVYLTNYETVRDGKLDPRLFDAASLDEADCFPAGTLIETPKGLVPIEDVRIGDEILNAYGVDHVADAFRKQIKRAVRVTSGNRVLVSSDNHRYFTSRGWVAASELRPGDTFVETSAAVRLLQQGDCPPGVARGQEEILQSILLSEMAGDHGRGQGERQKGAGSSGKSVTAAGASEHASALETAATMRMVRCHDHAADIPGSAEAILQPALLADVADASTGDRRCGSQSGGGGEARQKSGGMVGIGVADSGGRESAPGRIQFDGEPGVAGQGEPSASRTPAESAGRKWARADSAADGPVRSSRSGALGTGVSGTRVTSPAGLAHSPLSRHSAAQSESCDRGGRQQSPGAQAPRTGCEEDSLLGIARVDCVEILELGHPDLERFRDADGFIYFYDLTAARHPSFSVEGLLVHNCLRGFGGTKTFREFMALFAGDDRRDRSQRVVRDGIRYRFVATATPSPNDYIELLAYAAFLGIMDVPAAKTRFFKRNSEKADQLTLLPHKEEEFWLWVSSWAIFLTKPSDLGPEFSDDGYELPPLDLRWHEIPSDHTAAGTEKDGQGKLFADAAIGVQDAAREKRQSLGARITKMMELRAEDPAAHRILWHDLEAERHAIEKAIPTVSSVYGSQDLDSREQIVLDFKHGRIQELAGKPVMLGSGTNIQRHCHWAIFLGIGHKFKDLIQAIHRLLRFGQEHQVRIDLIYTEAEQPIRQNIERKWRQHLEMEKKMVQIIREYGLAHADAAGRLARAMGVERVEASGEHYTLVQNDTIRECAAMAGNSVDLIVTSIPFATQYEYSPNYADLGHSDDNAHFWAQMDYLIPNLLRVLKPGRIAAIHVKDRITPGGINGFGFQTVQPFSDECIQAFTKHGFAFLARKTIVTDVVRENNQTYRLGWTEQCKDGTRMGAGLPEYFLIFRKAPTDRSNGYADDPVVKRKPDCIDDDGNRVPWDKGLSEKGREVVGDGYSRGRWQFDAHGFMRSSGNRLLAPEELEGLDQAAIFQLFKKHSLENVYDYRHDVKIAETVAASGWLPSKFMLLQPQSWHPDVWADVVRMRTLNTLQAVKGKDQHLCPLPLDLVERAIEQYSMEGEVVFDPFAGLGTVPYCAIRMGRKGIGVELSGTYFLDACSHCASAERGRAVPDLFSLIEQEHEGEDDLAPPARKSRVAREESACH